MRGVTLLLATMLTGTYAFVATAAIVADRQSNVMTVEPAATVETGPVWYGGLLPPVTVEAPAPDGAPLAQNACPVPNNGVAAGVGVRLPAQRAI